MSGLTEIVWPVGVTCRLSPSVRFCVEGHFDTYDVEAIDDAGREWLGDWNLWCRTCQALVRPFGYGDLGETGAAKRPVAGYELVDTGLLLITRKAAEEARDNGR